MMTAPRLPPMPVGAVAPALAVLAAAYGVVVMALFVPWFLGVVPVPIALTPRCWLEHEMLLALVPAMLAVTLRTATTSGGEHRGMSSAVLIVFWLLGRLAIASTDQIDARLVFVACLAFPLTLAVWLCHASTKSHHRPGIAPVAMLAALILAETIFHFELWQTGRPRLTAAAIPAIVLFLHWDWATRNPACPSSRGLTSGIGPMLPLAEVFLAIGVLLIGVGLARDNPDMVVAGMQAWTTGALGAGILAMMLRVAGATSTAAPSTVAVSIAALVSAVAGTGAALDPGLTLTLLPLSAFAWCLAFGAAAVLLLRRRPAQT